MFQSQAAEVLSVVANQTCVCAAYGDAVVARAAEFIQAQNEMPAVDADGQTVNKFR